MDYYTSTLNPVSDDAADTLIELAQAGRRQDYYDLGRMLGVMPSCLDAVWHVLHVESPR